MITRKSRVKIRFASNHRAIGEADEQAKMIWNGGFEKENLKAFEHFRRHVSRSDYARISLDDKTSHSGANSLLVDFVGRDTTRLNTKVKRQIAPPPGIS